MDKGINILRDLDELIDEYRTNEENFESNRSAAAYDEVERSLNKLNNTVYWIRENLNGEELVQILSEEPVANEELIKEFLTSEEFNRTYN